MKPTDCVGTLVRAGRLRPDRDLRLGHLQGSGRQAVQGESQGVKGGDQGVIGDLGEGAGQLRRGVGGDAGGAPQVVLRGSHLSNSFEGL